MSNIVPLVRESPATRRLRERLGRATAAVQKPQREFVGELVAAMVDATREGVDGGIITAAAVGAINDLMQDLATTAEAARVELQRTLDRIRGVTP